MPYFTMKSIKKFWFYLHTNSEKLESILLAKFGTQPRHPIQLLHRTQHLEKISFVKKEKPLVSIIIPAFNQFDYTYSCLLAIHTNTSKINYEVIIADDASDQKTEKYFSLFENVRVFSNSSNQGFILNCNKAAGLAEGTYLLLLNNDTLVQPGWLDALLRVMEKDKSAGLVGSKLIYEDGRLQEAGGIIWNDASGINY